MQLYLPSSQTTRKEVKWGPRSYRVSGRGGRGICAGPSKGLDTVALSNSGHCSRYLKGVGLGSVA